MTKFVKQDPRYRKLTESYSQAEADGLFLTEAQGDVRYLLAGDYYKKAEVDALIAAVARDPDFADNELLLPFDGNLTDYSNSGLTVTSSGTVTFGTPSKFGQAAQFAGGYLSHSSPSVALREWWTGVWTVEAWIYPTDLSTWTFNGTQPSLIGNSAPTATTSYWSFGPIASGALAFHYFNGSSVIETSATTPITENNWHHVAASFDGTTMRIFADGTEVDSFTVSGTPQSASATPLTIGQINSINIVGAVDDLRLSSNARYTSAFTAPVIAHPLQA